MPASPDSPAPLVSTPVVHWHALECAEALRRLDADAASGLSASQARERLALHGPNRLAEKPPRPMWLAFAEQFRSLLILVLIGAAVLAGTVGDPKDAVMILIVVLINAGLGFWQEHRAEATLAALKKMLAPVARVRRAGGVIEVPAEQLVPGDVVLVEAGDRIPADGRLLATHNVEIDEAALTGESHVVGKYAQERVAPDAALADRMNMAYLNTVVTRGRAELLVTATGMASEMGRLSRLLDEAETQRTPLQIQLDSLGKRLTVIAVLVVSILFVMGLLRGDPLVQIMMTSIAVAVASIPEGLPAVLAVTLALGMHRMAQQRAIVKRLSAVETLGCTTVICSDKTGTLTMNQMTVRAVVTHGRRFSVTGEGYAANGIVRADDGGVLPDLGFLVHPAALANDSRIRDGQLIGDPTEGAMLALAAKSGVDVEALRQTHPRIAEIPFDSAHKFQASFHHEKDQVRICVKGAPDVLLDRSTHAADAQGDVPIDVGDWLARNDALAGDAMRVLAVATKTVPAQEFDPAGDLMAHIRGLTFCGLMGIMDPARPEARRAIAECARAGIAVKMITGDHRVTAAAIARDLGLHGEVIDGKELDALDPAALAARIDRIAVFSRVTPEHKVRIVKALRADGHITAMTGDGVNDAPALKHADIGVAMGITGTEVTKEAAVMVLTDDNFATIVRAVKEGRTIYDNMVKFLRSQLSTNMGAIQTLLGAAFMGLATPFTPIQILWFNIVMDGPPAMALGVDPANRGIMDNPPRRPDARVLDGPRLSLLLFWGVIIAIGTLGVYVWGLQSGLETPVVNTLVFVTFVMFQFFSILAARFERGSAIVNPNLFQNRWLWIALTTMMSLQVLVVHWGPAQAVFDTVDLSAGEWLLCLAVGSTVLIVDELRKLITGTWKPPR